MAHFIMQIQNLNKMIEKKTIIGDLSLSFYHGAKIGILAYGTSHPISAKGRTRVQRSRRMDHSAESRGGACVPGIETNYCEPEIAEFIHEP